MQSQLFTVSEACAFLKCGRTTLYRRLNGRQLKAVRCNGRTYITKAAIEEFINSFSDYEPRYEEASL